MRYFKLTIILVALVVAMLFAVAAQAETQVSPVQFAEGPFSSTVTQTSVAASNGNGKILVLQDEHFSAETHSARCHWTNGWNSGENANGTLYWFWDTHMYVCPSKTSPTGWAKVKGGMTGRDCGNAVRLKSKPPHNVVPRSRVKLVAHLTLVATVRVTATASTTGSAIATCTSSGGSASSSVSATGTATATAEATATASSFSKAVSTATSRATKLVTLKRSEVYAAAQTQATVSVNGKATAFCQGSIPRSCVETGTCPPPPTCPPGTVGTPPNCEKPQEHFTQVSCQLPEHIFVKDSDYMYCVATDDNGALISLDPFANDQFSKVSGQKSVEVRNQAGDPCPSGAQCFRLTILAGAVANENPGSEIIVLATANGVEATPWIGFVPIVEDNFGT